MIKKAIELALAYHKGQIKEDTGEPFIIHCLRVMLKMDTEEEKIAAVLHDIIEKTPCTFDELRKPGFNESTINEIYCLSKKENELYADYIERVKQNPIAVKIKIADLEDNMDLRRAEAFDSSIVNKLEKRKKYWNELINFKNKTIYIPPQ